MESEPKDLKKRNPFLIIKFQYAYEDEILYEVAENSQPLTIFEQQNQTEFETEKQIIPVQLKSPTLPKKQRKNAELFNNNYFWLSTVPLLLLMLTSFW